MENRSSFGNIPDDLVQMDSDLKHGFTLLEGAREKGYIYQRDLEDIALQALDRWQSVRAQVEAGVSQQSQTVHSSILGLNPLISFVSSKKGKLGYTVLPWAFNFAQCGDNYDS